MRTTVAVVQAGTVVPEPETDQDPLRSVVSASTAHEEPAR
jgi:hypothetical protein